MKKFYVFLLAASLFLTFGVAQAPAQEVPVALADIPAVAIDDGGIGDVLMFPIYDVRAVDGRTAQWQNFMVIENTSNQWTAFHLRFRSWKKSIEVYDHIILLSPFDVFWAVIDLAPAPGSTTDGQTYTAGEVRIWSQDYHTVYNSGLTYWTPGAGQTEKDFPGWLTKFQADLLDDCGFISNLSNLSDYDKYEMQAGHVEVIGVWQLSNPNAPDSDTHVLANVVLPGVYPDNAVNVYDVMDALFYKYTAITPTPARIGAWTNAAGGDPTLVLIDAVEHGPLNVDRWGLDCGNVLAGAFSMGDTSNARLQLSNFVAVRDFRTAVTDELPIIHRDGYVGGAIVYPVDTLFWIPYWTDSHYINENWATTIGPGFRDGNDLIGTAQITGGCGLWAVDAFNNTWSLDDFEAALANNEIWYHYFDGAFMVPGQGAYTTDVVIDFFTKHYHFFFADWPYWNSSTLYGPFAGAPAYYNAVYDYRGNKAGKVGTVGTYRSVEDGSGCNWGMDIQYWFEYQYGNGIVTGYPYVWDMEENLPTSTPEYTPPPGSPWHPEPPPVCKYIKHEVNIIRVGAPAPTSTGYITDANGFLTNPLPWIFPADYTMGHFAMRDIALGNGQRQLGPIYDTGAPYALPSIGVAIFDLNYDLVGNLYRSSMAPWHYRLANVNGD
ncbi:MAG: hypothetical protein JXA35_00715 [Deltaproteobacteria bacterium]|nr:hypothetical protein [Deltaproteobacteria bacterium]